MINTLIDEVEKNECLYLKSHPNFKKIQVKERIWEKIAAKLDTTPQACKTKWKSLRDSFSRELRSRDFSDSGSVDGTGEWKYFRRMEFIRPFVSRRPTMVSSCEPKEENPMYLEEEDGSESTEITSTPMPSTSEPADEPKPTVDVDIVSSLLDRIDNIVQKRIRSQNNTNKSFCEFVAQRLDAFPHHIANEIQLKFISILNEEERNMETNKFD